MTMKRQFNLLQKIIAKKKVTPDERIAVIDALFEIQDHINQLDDDLGKDAPPEDEPVKKQVKKRVAKKEK